MGLRCLEPTWRTRVGSTGFSDCVHSVCAPLATEHSLSQCFARAMVVGNAPWREMALPVPMRGHELGLSVCGVCEWGASELERKTGGALTVLCIELQLDCSPAFFSRHDIYSQRTAFICTVLEEDFHDFHHAVLTKPHFRERRKVCVAGESRSGSLRYS